MIAPAWVAGYGTNGFADHTLEATLDLLVENGYGAVALTLGHPHLDPFAADWRERTSDLASDLKERGLRVVVETGARYLLDPRRKHRPTLVDRDAEPRMRFLRRAIEVAQILDADCVSLWSGVLPDDVDHDEAWLLLVARLGEIAEYAADRGVVLSVEPEPGMVVETVADALRLLAALGDPPHVGVTVDLGHCVAVEPDGVVGALRAAGSRLRNVQVDDMMPGVHEHLELGDGELDLVAAIETLAEISYRGIAAVELPRHSHDAPRLAQTSLAALRSATRSARHPWTTAAVERVSREPERLDALFSAAGRSVGRVPLDASDPHGYLGTADDEARADLIEALFVAEAPAERLIEVYRGGDDAERRGVLRGLNRLAAEGRLAEPGAGSEPGGGWSSAATALVHDALRTNDPRLVAAGMGDAATIVLDDHAWRHGVLKLAFMGVPLRVVSGLEQRRDAELAAMADRFAAERRAAGRTVPDDLSLLQPRTER